MSNNLDPDQSRRFVWPDLGPKTVCQSYQQTTLVEPNFTNRLNMNQIVKMMKRADLTINRDLPVVSAPAP